MKNQTENTYQQLVNKVVDYICSHLNENIQLDTLATTMNISPYHFHRIMRAYLRESLAAYITRQRVERAAMYLNTQSLNLNELAEKVGFETAQSLSKAFKKNFGISPASYRKITHSEFTVKRHKSSFKKLKLSPEIINEEELNLIYIRIIGKYGTPDLYKNAWKKLTAYLKRNNSLTSGTRWIGISFDDPNITLYQHCRFYACATIKADFRPEGEFGYFKVKAGRYAVYKETKNYRNLQNMYDNIYRDFPFVFKDTVSFEEYHINAATTDITTQIYIPIE